MVAWEGPPAGSWGDRESEESTVVVSGTSSWVIWVASTTRVVSGTLDVAAAELEDLETGSGRHPRFDFSQRGQTQFLDLNERGSFEQQLRSWG